MLAEVYLELSGGRQRDLGLAPELAAASGLVVAANAAIRPARPHAANADELAAHAAFVAKLNDALWLKA